MAKGRSGGVHRTTPRAPTASTTPAGGATAAASAPAPAAATTTTPAAKGAVINNTSAMTLAKGRGQSGDELNNIYTHTSRAWNINEYARTGSLAKANQANNTPWTMTKKEITDSMKKIDARMRPMEKDTQTVRFVDYNFLTAQMGIDMTGLKATPANAQTLANVFNRQKGGWTDKGYTSTSWNVKQNVFTGKDVKLNVTIKKGTKTFITNNFQESEIIVGRNQAFKITGAHAEGKVLVMDVEV